LARVNNRAVETEFVFDRHGATDLSVVFWIAFDGFFFGLTFVTTHWLTPAERTRASVQTAGRPRHVPPGSLWACGVRIASGRASIAIRGEMSKPRRRDEPKRPIRS